MTVKTLYYSVESGGDGSAYPVWFETEELAHWHQEHLYEGWGESCTGCIKVRINHWLNDEIFCDELQTALGYYLDLLDNDDDNLQDFKDTFFPNGFPQVTVKIESKSIYHVMCKYKDKVLHKKFAWIPAINGAQTSEEGRLEYERKINGL